MKDELRPVVVFRGLAGDAEVICSNLIGHGIKAIVVGATFSGGVPVYGGWAGGTAEVLVAFRDLSAAKEVIACNEGPQDSSEPPDAEER